jgi:phosphoribosylformylglycinamidine synthase
VDLAEQAAALEALRAAARTGTLPTVHDVADGGLAVALAECCIEGGVGARIDYNALAEAVPSGGSPPGAVASGASLPGAVAADALLFGEGPGGAVIAGPPEAVREVPGARVIGESGGGSLEIAGALSLPIERLRSVYEGAIPAAFAAT